MAKKNDLQFAADLGEIAEAIGQVEEIAKGFQEDFTEHFKRLRKRYDEIVDRRYDSLTPWQRVQLARHPDRPQGSDYAQLMLDDFLELHGDRNFRDDKAIVGGFARLEGIQILFLGHQKGKTTREKLDCNFGMAHPEGYRKALRLMEMAEKFRLPIVTLIDTCGAYPGIEAEERGQAQAIAYNLFKMAGLRVPIVTVTIGEGGSGGALGIGVGDRILILENAYYSVISPEGCAGILWRDGNRAEEAADVLKLTAEELQGLGIVDEVVPEPTGGAHKDPRTTASSLKAAIARHLRDLLPLDREELVERRYQRLRRIGALEKAPTEG